VDPLPEVTVNISEKTHASTNILLVRDLKAYNSTCHQKDVSPLAIDAGEIFDGGTTDLRCQVDVRSSRKMSTTAFGGSFSQIAHRNPLQDTKPCGEIDSVFETRL
jgi:hypothetical protein